MKNAREMKLVLLKEEPRMRKMWPNPREWMKTRNGFFLQLVISNTTDATPKLVGSPSSEMKSPQNAMRVHIS